MSPELALEGQLSAKSDVFSFGILCLEIISGRQNTDINYLGTEMQTLLSWVCAISSFSFFLFLVMRLLVTVGVVCQAWSLQSKRQQLDMLDQRLRDSGCDEGQVKKVFCIALCATQDSVVARPSMSRIAAMLNDEETVPKLPAKPEAVKSLGLQNQNVSGTFTSSFVTPKYVTPSKKWLSKSKKHRHGGDPSDPDAVYRL